jgi:hypothetical protein
MSLDEMRDEFGDGFDPGWPLNIAQFALIPSGFEGNSVFTAECLACDLPVVAYGVGLMWRALQEDAPIGVLAPHSLRSTEMTVSMVRRQLFGDFESTPREWVSQFSVDAWAAEWKRYLQQEFGYVASAH